MASGPSQSWRRDLSRVVLYPCGRLSCAAVFGPWHASVIVFNRPPAVMIGGVFFHCRRSTMRRGDFDRGA
eukprot:4249524-Alexandrium_andersonii.AAC.1